MQDIIPPHRIPRGSIKPPVRGAQPSRRPPAKVFYSRQQIINGSTGAVELIAEEVILAPVFEPAPMTRPIEALSGREKLSAMERALANARAELRRERRKQLDMKRFGIVLVASLFVLVTGYVSIDTIITNNQVKAEVSQGNGAGSGPGAAAGSWSKDSEGKDEAPVSHETFKGYSVAPDYPKTISIPKLDVRARVLPMGINYDNSVQAPYNIYDAGWYTGSVVPGDIGAAFINGHASGPTREGLFANLDKLKKGDRIHLEKGDGTQLKYDVVKVSVVDYKDVDMKKVLLPLDGTLRGLNLMTCAGEWDASAGTLDKRVIVWAAQV